MRLLYVFTDLPDQPGTFSFAEVEAMAERGFQVEILCLRSRLADGAGARSLRARFPVHAAPYVSVPVLGACLRGFIRHPLRALGLIVRSVVDTWNSPRILIKTVAILPKAFWFAERIRGDAGDVRLHAFWASLPARAAWAIARMSDLPYDTWAHAGADIYNRRHQSEPALRTVLSDAHLILTCNRANLPYFERILPVDALRRVHYHPHGVDLERFRPHRGETIPPRDAEAPLTLLSVGRLSLAKGFQHAIEACALLRERGVDFEYRIVGDGPLRESMAATIQSRSLGDRVILLGALDQSELPDLYRASDALLAPSIIGPAGARDGLPNVVVEAMACGIPCIGSDTVGIPEAVRTGETGILVPPGDAAGLADAMQRLAEDRGSCRRMGEAAHAWVTQEFARPACMDRLSRLLLDAQESAGRHAAS
ncbi:MAG: glycosyltransferase family 4 protein [Candidatus Eisenbacteria bacterium]